MHSNLIGKHVIVRAETAGVFFGILEEKEGTTVKLSNCRKLHYWVGAGAVEQLAVDGTSKPQECRFTVIVPSMIIEQEIQLIPCSEKSIESLSSVKEWKK
jgi:hypothetical protein